jgi:hypothetical protein
MARCSHRSGAACFVSISLLLDYQSWQLELKVVGRQELFVGDSEVTGILFVVGDKKSVAFTLLLALLLSATDSSHYPVPQL